VLFAQCLEKHPSHPQVIGGSVSFLDELGDSEEATQILRDALARHPTDLLQRVALASRLNALDQPTAAEDLLLEVTQEQPFVWSALVDHYVEVDDRDNALLALEEALSAAGKAAPEDWTLLRADLLIQSGRLAEASEAIGQIKSEVYVTTARGRLELARHNPEKALRLLEQGIRLWPDNPMARYLAAQAAEQLGDFERAESEYREAYRSDPAYTDAGLQLAALLASRGLPGDAADLANAYTTANIDDPKGWEAMIEYALASKRGEKARSTLARYQNIPELRSDATAFAARYLLRVGRPDDARKAIVTSRANLAAVENIETLRAWCDVLVAQQRAGVALERLEEMLERSPDRIEISALRARTLYAAGRSGEARKVYESLLKHHPANLESLVGLAEIESDQGRAERAIALFDAAASVDTEDSGSSVAAAMLSVSTADKEQRLREALLRNPRDGRAARELLSILLVREAGASSEALDLANRARRFAAGKASEDAYAEVVRARNLRTD
jgi:predicted Zn-dependent protease